MRLNDIRETFLKYFEANGHLRLKSASLRPVCDTSLLIVNSGMAPLKAYFTGREAPPSKRVATCQKCIRTTDIERVGKTARHGTFFEMLGNFSFGDYFKAEAIAWAYDFMTNTVKIPESKLSASVYAEDDEAYGIWRKKIGLTDDKIIRLGKADNFWEVGPGPCGPCSEIYFDRGSDTGCGRPACAPGCECDRFVEIWNLVFTQFDKTESGEYEKLKNPNIDTGMGLERLAACLQGASSLFDVDAVKTIRESVCAILNKTDAYGRGGKTDVSIKIITDHVRALTFLIADGIAPANDGAGYITKKLLRRAATHGRLLKFDGLFLREAVNAVIGAYSAAYPELSEKSSYILSSVAADEGAFYNTLTDGMKLIEGQAAALKRAKNSVMPGEEAFKLYDTFGFPLELTKELLAGDGITVLEGAFFAEMEKQKERARNARGASTYMGREDTVFDAVSNIEPTRFVGYDTLRADAEITAIVKGGRAAAGANEGEMAAFFLNQTPFYAESGGQMGDCGVISGKDFEINVTLCAKANGKYAHFGTVSKGAAVLGAVSAEANRAARQKVSANHTATHLLHKALREVLGNRAEQAGSKVTPDRLRFDFTHPEPLTKDEIEKAQSLVNAKIREGLPVSTAVMTLEEAKKTGAVALFNEKYADSVRVVSAGDYSAELCGGTHVKNTLEIGVFKIVSQSGVAAGTRRVEAQTGEAALRAFEASEKTLQEAAAALKTAPSGLTEKIEAMCAQNRELSAKIERLQTEALNQKTLSLLNSAETRGDFSCVFAQTDCEDAASLCKANDLLRERFDGLIFLSARSGNVLTFFATAPQGYAKRGVDCGEIIKAAAASCGGGGGGSKTAARAGGGGASKAADAFDAAKNTFYAQIKTKL